MSTPDFVSEKIVPRKKTYLIDFPLKELRDPSVDHMQTVANRFKEVFGKDALDFGTVTAEILEENLEADSVEILVTGHVRYFVPSNKTVEDYFR